MLSMIKDQPLYCASIGLLTYASLSVVSSQFSLRQRFFNQLWKYLGPITDKFLSKHKKRLFSEAHGKVLDVGSGIGVTLKYLEMERDKPIDTVVCLEPNPFMQSSLIENVNQVSQFSVKVIPKTIAQAIEAGDIKNGTFDTVICNLVLCSIPEQEKILYEIQSLLKPGGKLLFIEHVIAKSNWHIFQEIINPLWNCVGDGCSLIRKTDEYITMMDGWSNAIIEEIPRRKYFELRHVCGICTKE